MSIRIGVTERGDAGLDFSWVKNASTVDGMILITKRITNTFIMNVVSLHKKGIKIIVHCTCTGWGGTVVEPNVPEPSVQLGMLNTLIESGFPRDNCVLRIDPIIPTEAGISTACKVINSAYDIGLLPNMRIRISLLDEYKHVKKRYLDAGFSTVYHDKFGPSSQMIADVLNALSEYYLKYELCAEKYFPDNQQFLKVGCVSDIDMRILGITDDSEGINPQNRNGCLCSSAKRELLSNKQPCKHNCIYCYWKREGE